jgi:hypothetical protein
MSDGASHNPFSGIADVPLSPRAAKRHVLIRSTVFVEREEKRREHQSLINARREQRSPTGITLDTLSGDRSCTYPTKAFSSLSSSESLPDIWQAG